MAPQAGNAVELVEDDPVSTVQPEERGAATPLCPWPHVTPTPQPGGPTGSRPTFSIVIAAFQAEATISEALESALTQTYPALEIIVCDDGSTDRTADVLNSYGTSITVVRQDNLGEAAAKNTAVRQARGDYVVVLDADDVFLPQRLEALAWLAMSRPDLDILVTDAVVEADGMPLRRAYHAEWPFPLSDQRAAILDRNFVLGLCAVRRERWLAAEGFDPQLAYAADWDFWQRLILSGSRVGLVNEPLARYRLKVGTLSSNRVHLVRARLEVLSRASRRHDLTPQERGVLTLAMRRERRELVCRLADGSLAQGGWQARRQFAKILLGPNFGARARLGAILAIASPRTAARRREKRGGGMVEIGAGIRVRRPLSDPRGGQRAS